MWACTGRSRSPQTLRPLNQIPQSPAWREGEVGGEVTLRGKCHCMDPSCHWLPHRPGDGLGLNLPVEYALVWMGFKDCWHETTTFLGSTFFPILTVLYPHPSSFLLTTLLICVQCQLSFSCCLSLYSIKCNSQCSNQNVSVLLFLSWGRTHEQKRTNAFLLHVKELHWDPWIKHSKQSLSNTCLMEYLNNGIIKPSGATADK